LKKHTSVSEDAAASIFGVPNSKLLRQSWLYKHPALRDFSRIKPVFIVNTMTSFFCKIQITMYLRITIWLVLRKPLPTPNSKLTQILYQ
jgi:hypothetical protein